MKTNYDVIVVGAGPTGIFTAYELMTKDPNVSILLVDKGLDIYKRHCPLLNKQVKQCPIDTKGKNGCHPSCSITCGFGGSGAYSDGKFNITSEFGGWMNEYLPDEEVLSLIKYVDEINLRHGAPEELTDPNTEEVYRLEKKASASGLKLLRNQVRHMGTEVNLNVLKSIREHLAKRVDIMFRSNVVDIIVEDGFAKGIILEDGTKLFSKYVVLGVGRTGSNWLRQTLMKYGVEFSNNKVDVGVRVETNNIIMDEINKYLYEGKFIYTTSVGTQVRTFCSNPNGHVVIENHEGVMICNGHSFHDEKLGSNNTNFALLVSHEFDTPFKDPNEYAMEISKLANKLSGGSVIVQNYGDILQGRRSTKKRIDEGFVKPTLKEAVPGDLSLILPYKTMKSLIEMIEVLNNVTPGIASSHTLFYGVEAKFYSDRVKVSNDFETKIDNLFVGGDGAGITRGLAQSAANGIYIARVIANRLKG